MSKPNDLREKWKEPFSSVFVPHNNSPLKFPLLLSNLLPLYLPDNLREGAEQKVVFITGRVHPGETPSSFVCQGKSRPHERTVPPSVSNWGTAGLWDHVATCRVLILGDSLLHFSRGYTRSPLVVVPLDVYGLHVRMEEWMNEQTDGWMCK